MNYAQVNVEALSRAVAMVAGPQALGLITTLYQNLDAAERSGYDNGYAVGHDDGEEAGLKSTSSYLSSGQYAEGYQDGVEDEQENHELRDYMIGMFVRQAALAGDAAALAKESVVTINEEAFGG